MAAQPEIPESPDDLAWFCVRTKPRRESLAQVHLDRQGWDTFLPKLRKKYFVKNKVRWITSPLFPRYLFLRHSRTETLAAVHSTLGVTSLVSFGDRPASIPDEVIDEIKRRCRRDVLREKQPPFKEGDRIRIGGGIYKGMEAIFARNTSERERVIILLEIMASVAQVQISRDFLDHAAPEL